MALHFLLFLETTFLAGWNALKRSFLKIKSSLAKKKIIFSPIGIFFSNNNLLPQNIQCCTSYYHSLIHFTLCIRTSLWAASAKM
uniref:Putative secreted protein n=1 Tax=Ixodes ricinus TaxID=34613 RepID=A0A147BJ19_IXORI